MIYCKVLGDRSIKLIPALASAKKERNRPALPPLYLDEKLSIEISPPNTTTPPPPSLTHIWAESKRRGRRSEGGGAEVWTGHWAAIDPCLDHIRRQFVLNFRSRLWSQCQPDSCLELNRSKPSPLEAPPFCSSVNFPSFVPSHAPLKPESHLQVDPSPPPFFDRCALNEHTSNPGPTFVWYLSLFGASLWVTAD